MYGVPPCRRAVVSSLQSILDPRCDVRLRGVPKGLTTEPASDSARGPAARFANALTPRPDRYSLSDPRRRRCPGFVFPYSNNAPISFTESRSGICVAVAVVCEFLDPPSGIGLGNGPVSWTEVPEATVYEDRDPSFTKYDIGAPSCAGQNRTVDPKA
jgi:hypothetical protein